MGLVVLFADKAEDKDYSAETKHESDYTALVSILEEKCGSVEYVIKNN